MPDVRNSAPTAKAFVLPIRKTCSGPGDGNPAHDNASSLKPPALSPATVNVPFQPMLMACWVMSIGKPHEPGVLLAMHEGAEHASPGGHVRAQAVPAPQVPHEPPHPSSPQVAPWQSGVQLASQAGGLLHTPATHAKPSQHGREPLHASPSCTHAGPDASPHDAGGPAFLAMK